MGSIISHIDEKIEEHGSLQAYKSHLHTPQWDERHAPVCEKHNYKGYLCQGCYQEKIKGMADLLRDCVRAFNELPNNTLHGNYPDTYQLCSAIEQQINQTPDV